MLTRVWMAFSIAPAEGDAVVAVRHLKTGKEMRFPAGPAATATSAAGAGGQ
jgi:hypothetical protein